MTNTTAAVCHPGRRVRARGRCEVCYRRDRRAANPAVDESYRAAMRRRRERHRYGFEPGDYERLLAVQGGTCAICARPPAHERLHVDHDHASGEVRGLLCADCNRAIGLFREAPTTLRAAATYIEAHK